MHSGGRFFRAHGPGRHDGRGKAGISARDQPPLASPSRDPARHAGSGGRAVDAEEAWQRSRLNLKRGSGSEMAKDSRGHAAGRAQRLALLWWEVREGVVSLRGAGALSAAARLALRKDAVR